MRRLGLLLVFVLVGLGFWYLTRATFDGGDHSATTPAPPAKVVLHRGNGPEPESLDPQLARSESAFNIARDLFEGLTALDGDGNVIPGAASSWQHSADGKTYQFTLRANARWSNGDALTADDFAAGWRRLVDPATASEYAQVLGAVVSAREITAGKLPAAKLGVEAPTATTFIVHLAGPTPYFLGLLAHPSTFPVHRATLAAHPTDVAKPGIQVSNGAFVAVDWSVGSHITARRNPYYWDNASNQIDELELYHYSDQDAELKSYRGGELDVTYTIPQQQFRWLKENLGAELKVSPYLSTYFYGFNVTRPPFRNQPGLRRALSMVIDRERIAQSVTGVGELPAYSFVPPGISGYTPQAADYQSWTPERRLDEARRLYAAAGYTGAHPLVVELRYNTGEVHNAIAVAIADMWKQALGVETKLTKEEFKVLLVDISQKQVTQVFRSSWIGDYNDAFNFLEVLQTGVGVNHPGYSNPDYDALIRKAAGTVDLTERRATLEAAERMMLADQPLAPIYFYVNKHLVKPYVHGWRQNVMNVIYSKNLSMDPH
jgi:oligopeptide transport system substrate-binding protein